MDGDVAVDSTLAGRVAMTAARLQSGEFWPGARAGLTQRESEVLGLMVRGLSNRAIALRLSVGEDTVKTHARPSTASSRCPTGPKRWPSPCVRGSSTERKRTRSTDPAGNW